jgi:hypothetical protein
VTALAIQVITILSAAIGSFLLWVILRHRRELKEQVTRLQTEARLRKEIEATNVETDPLCPQGKVYIMNPRDAERLGLRKL